MNYTHILKNKSYAVCGSSLADGTVSHLRVNSPPMNYTHILKNKSYAVCGSSLADGTVSPLRVNSPPMNYTHILKNKSYAVCGSSLADGTVSHLRVNSPPMNYTHILKNKSYAVCGSSLADGTVSPLRVNSPPMNYTHILKNKSYAVCGSSLADGTVSPLRVNSPPMNYTHILKNKSYAVCGSSSRSVLDLSCTVFSSRPPFKEDLTMDGDVESNPGPLSKDSLEYLNPGQWIDDYALSEYSKHQFKEANLDWECYFIAPDEMWSDFLTDGYCQNKIDDARERSTRYFAVPLNDAMNTTGGSGGVHWGLMVIDCAENNAIFVDPIVGSSYLSSVVDELCRKVTLNVQRVNITKTQTPNDCGIYVIGYIQKFVELISRDGINLSLISIERALIQVNIELNAADLRKQIQKLFTYVDDQLFIKYSKILVESTGLIFYDYVIGPTDLYPLLYGDQPYNKYPFSDFLTQKFFQCGQNNQQMLLVPVNSAMCDLTADGRHWGLIILIISSPTSHILFIDPTYVEDDYAREFPANQMPVAPSSSNLFTIVSKIYSVLSMCETRNIEFIPSNIKHTLTDSGFCVLEYIDLLMNLDQSVVIRWTDVKELLGNTTIAVHESRSKILEHFETFSPVELSRVSASPISGKRLASTKASTGLSTKKRKAKISDIPSPRGSPLIQRNKFRTTSSLVSTGDTPIRKTHRRMSTLESSEVPPSELPPKIKASIMSYPSPIQEEIQKWK
ncbi:hypothetical protein GEMRC1_006640 [Eukaryota sp. GEM-RC1]